MKRFILILLLASIVFPVKASHFTGGEIWYEYIGDSAHPYRYMVYLNLYRDYTGVASTLCGSSGPCSVVICASSGCYSNNTFAVQLKNFTLTLGSDTVRGTHPYSIQVPELNECTDSNSIGIRKIEMYRFEGSVDLQGPCTDFVFQFSQCCRSGATNLNNGAAEDFSVKAFLNNSTGPNSSPAFTGPGIKAFCVNTKHSWPTIVSEEDGDSLYFSLRKPLSPQIFNNCATTVNYVPYNPGFDEKNFMLAVPPVHLDSLTGVLSFTPSQVQIAAHRLDIEEFRYDSLLQSYYLVGSSSRDLPIHVVSNCVNDSNNLWISMFSDSLGNALPIQCGDSIIKLSSRKLLHSLSLAPDGTDFRLLNSLGQPVPIVSAGVYSYGDQEVVTKEFWLKLNDTIYYNDTLTLITRKGNDANTLLNLCGQELPVGDSISLIVNSCNTGIDVKEVTLDPQMHLYPNPVESSLTIEFPASIGSGIIEIYNLNSRRVLTKRYSSDEVTLDVDILPAGIYMVKATSNKWSQTLKFEKF